MEPAAKDVERTIVAAVEAIGSMTDMQKAAVLGGQLIKVLQAGIVEVSTRRRFAVRGLHAGGHSYQQIGDMLGISKAGVVAIDKG